MANTKSAEKRNRQNEKRRIQNRSFRNRVRTYIKKARAAIESAASGADPKKGAEAAANPEEAVKIAIRDLDTAASRGTLHPRNAARRKSRLMKQLAALKK
jgi:small subunit ribosomal protein S20